MNLKILTQSPKLWQRAQRMAGGSAGIAGLLLVVHLSWPAAAENDPTALLRSWLGAQTNLQTWSAEVRQTRTLKALVQPLVSTGRVWFAAPNRFRWELGQPAQTIAVRQADQLLILYPKLSRAERYPLTGDQPGPWRDAMALFEAGFPRSQADLEAQFKMLSLRDGNGTGQLALQPKATGARRFMPRIEIEFATDTGALRATALTFADGSTMRNEFSRAILNPELDPALFELAVPAGFKVSDPWAKGKKDKKDGRDKRDKRE